MTVTADIFGIGKLKTTLQYNYGGNHLSITVMKLHNNLVPSNYHIKIHHEYFCVVFCISHSKVNPLISIYSTKNAMEQWS